MKNTRGGVHEPGIRRAGAPDDAAGARPTQAAFDALTATVAQQASVISQLYQGMTIMNGTIQTATAAAAAAQVAADNAFSAMISVADTVNGVVFAPVRWLTDQDASSDAQHGTYFAGSGVLTEPRTLILSVDDATPRLGVLVAVKLSAGSGYQPLAVVNGGPAGGTLFTLGVPPLADRAPGYAAEFVFDGTNYVLDRHYLL